jgi:hypothetical protein
MSKQVLKQKRFFQTEYFLKIGIKCIETKKIKDPIKTVQTHLVYVRSAQKLMCDGWYVPT